MKSFLTDLLGADRVRHEPAALAPYREDYTELEAGEPELVAFVREVPEVQRIVVEARARRVPLTPCVYRTNVGGLTIPARGGVVLDMTQMNRILEVNEADMVAVIEPGVTQQGLKDHLNERGLPLTLGYSLAPPSTSVLANALLGGLTNRSLKYGDQSEAISGLEVVLSDGSLARTGAWAMAGVPPFGLVPFPGLTGLFTAWQGTTGIATKMAFQLWPKHPFGRRLFVLCYSARGTYEAMRRLCRKEICDDIGGLSWPAGKMMMGVPKPGTSPIEGEPTFYLYLDLTAELEEELALKERMVRGVLADLRREGERFEEPFDIQTLLRVNPIMGKFADFPTDLEFLTNHGGGGLTWIGTYGPISRFDDAADAGVAIMARHGIAPLIVSRAMRGGHYGVLRFVTTFDKRDAAEVARVRAVGAELLTMLSDRGFVMYKTPAWAWEALRPRLDPGMLRLMADVRALMDPAGILNPGRLPL